MTALNTSFAIDLSTVTPDLLAALSKAQAAVGTVGKDGNNKSAGYRYASGEAMIRGSRGPLTDNGLAFFSTWTREATADAGGDIGKQFVCASVRLHWVLSHAGGGMLSGVADMDAIGSARRPPDKAVAATLTYMRGFILRELLNMDRGDEDGDAVDARNDDQGWTPRQQRRPAPPREDPRAIAAKRMGEEAKRYLAKAKDLGLDRTGDHVREIATDAIARAWDTTAMHTVAEYEQVRRAIVLAIETLDAERGHGNSATAGELDHDVEDVLDPPPPPDVDDGTYEQDNPPGGSVGLSFHHNADGTVGRSE